MFIDQIKSDFKNYGREISEVKKELENWTQFINPYHRILTAIDQHFIKLNELDIDPVVDKIHQPVNIEEAKNFGQRWDEVSDKYSHVLGLAFGIRTMLPVLAESFINLVLFVLCKPEIKLNQRLFQNILRQQIDIRVQSLTLNCNGFEKAIDYKSDECKKFHTLMNERNDLLHGNVEVQKLAIGDVYFNETIPIFNQYEDFWDKSIGVSMKSIKFVTLQSDRDVVDDFIEYILSKMKVSVRHEFEQIMKKGQLGYNKITDRVGILFPEHLVDFRMDIKK